MIQVCRAIYTEAASILYYRNTFRFEDDDALPFFIQRLTGTSFASLSNLDLVFPHLYWEDSGEDVGVVMSTYTAWFVHTINKMHGIRTLRLRFLRDILDCDLRVLEQLSCGTSTKKFMIETSRRHCSSRKKLQTARENFCEWGWDVTET